MYKMSLTL